MYKITIFITLLATSTIALQPWGEFRIFDQIENNKISEEMMEQFFPSEQSIEEKYNFQFQQAPEVEDYDFLNEEYEDDYEETDDEIEFGLDDVTDFDGLNIDRPKKFLSMDDLDIHEGHDHHHNQHGYKCVHDQHQGKWEDFEETFDPNSEMSYEEQRETYRSQSLRKKLLREPWKPLRVVYKYRLNNVPQHIL